jgi:hypothetical protein
MVRILEPDAAHSGLQGIGQSGSQIIIFCKIALLV